MTSLFLVCFFLATFCAILALGAWFGETVMPAIEQHLEAVARANKRRRESLLEAARNEKRRAFRRKFINRWR